MGGRGRPLRNAVFAAFGVCRSGWMGWKEAFVRPTVRTSLIQLARAFEEEGGKKGGRRERGEGGKKPSAAKFGINFPQ